MGPLPYAHFRHPIYSGLDLAALGGALAIDEWRCVLGVFLIVLGYWIKARIEERMLCRNRLDGATRDITRACAGRITRLEKYEYYSIIGMEFPEIEAPGMLARMKGGLDRTLGIASISRRYVMHGGTPPLPGEGVFPVNDTQLHLAKGCIMIWRT